jgi:hypothetical protein
LRLATNHHHRPRCVDAVARWWFVACLGLQCMLLQLMRLIRKFVVLCLKPVSVIWLPHAWRHHTQIIVATLTFWADGVSLGRLYQATESACTLTGPRVPHGASCDGVHASRAAAALQCELEAIETIYCLIAVLHLEWARCKHTAKFSIGCLSHAVVVHQTR